jgi:RNA-directed DNA polymerase
VVSFDNLDHRWLIKFVEHRVADPRILRLIQKWLKAGAAHDDPQAHASQAATD